MGPGVLEFRTITLFAFFSLTGSRFSFSLQEMLETNLLQAMTALSHFADPRF